MYSPSLVFIAPFTVLISFLISRKEGPRHRAKTLPEFLSLQARAVSAFAMIQLNLSGVGHL